MGLKLIPVLGAMACLAACGGGGGSGNNSAPISTGPVSLPALDSLPTDGAVAVRPQIGVITLAHPGFDDLNMNYTGDCTVGALTHRALEDMSSDAFNGLIEHHISCNPLEENSQLSVTVTGRRGGGSAAGDDYEVPLLASTGLSWPSSMSVDDSVMLPAETLATLVSAYLGTQLVADLELPLGSSTLIEPLIQELIGNTWPNLTMPSLPNPVMARRVRYVSQNPNGEVSDQLSGLIVVPEVTTGFVPRDRVVMVLHSTGVTPSDLDPADAWYLIAAMLASRGYVVVVPDNWGRGATSLNQETYLLGSRTAMNARDFLLAALDDPAVVPLLAGSGSQVALVGYSQGGHSSLALWRLFKMSQDGITVREVFAGGGPYNLYETFRGVVARQDDTCDGGNYCRLVDESVALPFALDRILPGMLSYTATGLSERDIVQGPRFRRSFVRGFLDNEPDYDTLKQLLQLNSYTNIIPTGPAGSAEFFLYHSSFDRLVPYQNQTDLRAVLVDYPVHLLSGLCNGPTYETIFNLTSQVGVLHGLCGIAMMNDLLDRL